MYKIIFKNPENERERIEKNLSEFEAGKAIKAKKDKTVYSVPNFGIIDSFLIITIKRVQTGCISLPEALTRFDAEPPSEKDWKAIRYGFVYEHPYSIIAHFSNNVMRGLCKGIWNLNNERTERILTIGHSLIDDGQTMRMIIKGIAAKKE